MQLTSDEKKTKKLFFTNKSIFNKQGQKGQEINLIKDKTTIIPNNTACIKLQGTPEIYMNKQ